VISVGARWNVGGLGVHGDDVRWGFTHGASRDVWHDVVAHERHGRDWQVGCKPVRLAVSASVSAGLGVGAVGVWHGAESLNARAGRTEVLGLMLHVAGGVKERVA